MLVLTTLSITLIANLVMCFTSKISWHSLLDMPIDDKN